MVLTKFINNAKFFNLSNNLINHYHSTYYSNLSVKFASYIDQYMLIASLVKLCCGIYQHHCTTRWKDLSNLIPNNKITCYYDIIDGNVL